MRKTVALRQAENRQGRSVGINPAKTTNTLLFRRTRGLIASIEPRGPHKNAQNWTQRGKPLAGQKTGLFNLQTRLF